MKLNYIFSLFILMLLGMASYGQSRDTTSTERRLILDFTIFDLPFLRDAAAMTARDRQSLSSGAPVAEKAVDYARAMTNPSMRQAMAITQNLHGTNYYLNNKLWDRWIKPDTKKKKVLNRLAANATAGVVDLALAYQVMIFSPVWLHEEFHRATMTTRGIPTNNNVFQAIVDEVKDEDLIRFKATAPQEMVRSFAAGTESEYLLLRNLQKDNFFKKTNYPNVLLNILLTKHAVDYVNQFKDKGFDEGIDRNNQNDPIELERDFVGWDFTPWVYDLFRPNEPYTARGAHPSGTGIDRAIKASDLTREEYRYLEKMGRLQYLNFLSPFMVGVQRIRFNQSTSFNFAVRHYLTSFGSDITTDLFVDRRDKKWMLSFHGYQNKDHFFPGLELEYPVADVKIGSAIIPLYSRGMIWLQPEKQSFYSDKGKAGGLVQLRAHLPLGRTWSMYAEGEAKSNGWVAGNPYLKSNVSVRMGLAFDIKPRSADIN